MVHFLYLDNVIQTFIHSKFMAFKQNNHRSFVNQNFCAQGMVNECYGAPAENLGATFLVVWHYNDSTYPFEKEVFIHLFEPIQILRF